MEISTAERVDAAIEASGIRALGFSCHLKAADGSMQILSSTKYYTSVRVYAKGSEIHATYFNMLPQSMIKVAIEECSFPHPKMINFIGQIERVSSMWHMQQGN